MSSYVFKSNKVPVTKMLQLLIFLFFLTGVYTKECMKNYKSLEAHNFFTSGKICYRTLCK